MPFLIPNSGNSGRVIRSFLRCVASQPTAGRNIEIKQRAGLHALTYRENYRLPANSDRLQSRRTKDDPAAGICDNGSVYHGALASPTYRATRCRV